MGISCSTSLTCIAVGDSGNTADGSTIFGTSTGGVAWASQTPPFGVADFASIACPTQNVCFAAGTDSIAASTNDGNFLESRCNSHRALTVFTGISCAMTTICSAVGFRHLWQPRGDRYVRRWLRVDIGVGADGCRLAGGCGLQRAIHLSSHRNWQRRASEHPRHNKRRHLMGARNSAGRRGLADRSQLPVPDRLLRRRRIDHPGRTGDARDL